MLPSFGWVRRNFPNSSFPPQLSIKREITLHSGYRAILSCFLHLQHSCATLAPVQIPRYVLLLPVVVRALSNFFLLRFLVVPINNEKHQQQQQKTQLFIRVWSSATRSINQKVGVFLFYSFSSTLPLHTLRSKLYDFPSCNSFLLFSGFALPAKMNTASAA